MLSALLAMRRHPLRWLTASLFFCAAVAFAAGPGWWTQREVLTEQTPNDYAPLNQGQLKHLAAQAAAEMNENFPGGAGSTINDLVATWRDVPALGVIRNDFAPVSHGQLKALAKLFYDRLAEEEYSGPPLLSGAIYPWTTTTSDDINDAVVNIGQAKFLFSFNPASHGIDIENPNGDDDGDGLSNLDEYLHGTDPLKADTDDDGIPDGIEVALGMNPLVADLDTLPSKVGGLKLFLKADAGVVLDIDGNVEQWQDQSGNTFHTLASSSENRPLWVEDALAGKATLRFDGANDVLELPDLMDGLSSGEIFVVSRLNDTSNAYNGLMHFGTGYGTAYATDESELIWDDFGIENGNPYEGPGLALLMAPNLYNASVSSAGVSVLSFNGVEHLRREDQTVAFSYHPILGADHLSEYFKGDISEVVVYNRVLTANERKALNFYFKAKYGIGAVEEEVVPTAGLQVWLKADAAVAHENGIIETWHDSSGHGNHAFQLNEDDRPVLVGGGENPKSIYFDGEFKSLELPDVLSTASAGEVIIVARVKNFTTSPSGLAHFGMNWGTSYNYDVSESENVWVKEDFGRGDGENFEGPSPATLKSFHIYNSSIGTDGVAVRSINGREYHRVEGASVVFRDNPLLGATWQGEFLDGDIAEVLVYDRVLGETERASLLAYLKQKYEIETDLPEGIDPDADEDGDGLSNYLEFYVLGTDWRQADTDGDGMNDGYEIAMGLNPLLADRDADLDGDGVPNGEDARPNDPSIGRLMISIQFPLGGSTLP